MTEPRVLKNILYADDEPDVLLVGQMCLETVGGYHVTGVANGNEAIKTAAESVPDLIMLDVMMFPLDGPATLLELRKNEALDNVPIIFVTARIRETEVNEYLALGANGVVAKPFDPMALSDQIEQWWKKFHDGR